MLFISISFKEEDLVSRIITNLNGFTGIVSSVNTRFRRITIIDGRKKEHVINYDNPSDLGFDSTVELNELVDKKVKVVPEEIAVIPIKSISITL